MKKNLIVTLALVGGITTALSAGTAQAAVDEQTAKTYDGIIKNEEAKDQIDVLVKGSVQENGGEKVKREVRVQASGIQEEGKFTLFIDSTTGDLETKYYYSDGVYRVSSSSGTQDTDMDEKDARKILNSHVFLYLDSEYLTDLSSEAGDNDTTIYTISADSDSVNNYIKEQLTEAGVNSIDDVTGGMFDVTSLTGTVTTDAEDNVIGRKVELECEMNLDNEKKEMVIDYDAEYISGDVTSSGADVLRKTDSKSSVVTAASGTVYATGDVNVRQSPSTSGAVLGVASAGDALTVTGKTADNWYRINYNGRDGYVSGKYVSSEKSGSKADSKVSESSGQVCTAVDTNFRSAPSGDASIITVIPANTVLEQTGSTESGWIQVTYQGSTGYIAASCTGWNQYKEGDDTKLYYMEGTVSNLTINTVTITNANGDSFVMNISNCDFDLADSIQAGDWVSVNYKISGNSYYAFSIADSNTHGGSQEDPEEDDGMYGTITNLDFSTVSVTTNAGTVFSGELDSIDISGLIGVGVYVKFYTMSDEIYKMICY